MRPAARNPAASCDPVVDGPTGAGSSASATYFRDGRVPGTASNRLVDRARDGDREAFEMLIGPRIEPAFHSAMAILGNEADARDAVQDAMLDGWRGIRRLRDADRFDAWLGRIIVNACRSIGRRRGRAKVREIPIVALTDTEDPPNPATPVDEEACRLDELERAFGRLPVAQRTLLALHHLDHRPVAELAQILGVPEGTVKWRLHAARDALERSLAEERR
jgi:RNA polymerase sigma-70 factor (ECF subfamily)